MAGGLGNNSWEELEVGGDGPGCLQEHSLVSHNNALYVFGGEISFSNAAETPLWIYDIQVSNTLGDCYTVYSKKQIKNVNKRGNFTLKIKHLKLVSRDFQENVFS